MRTAKRVAVVDQVAAIADVQCLEFYGPALTEGLTDRNVNGRMRRQVPRAVAVEESGTVRNASRCPAPLRKSHRKDTAQRVPLVVIEEKVAARRGREVGQPARDAALAFRVLMRVGHVQLSSMQKLGRTRRRFPPANARLSDGQGQEDVRVADDVVIEEVPRSGPEVIHVENPFVERDGEAEFVLFIALSVQGEEPDSLVEREVQQRP